MKIISSVIEWRYIECFKVNENEYENIQVTVSAVGFVVA